MDIVRPEGDVLNALDLVFVEVFLYLTLVVLTFVDRDADLAARRSQGARKQPGLLALDAEVTNFPEVEQLFIEAGPDVHVAASDVMGQMIDAREPDRIGRRVRRP